MLTWRELSVCATKLGVQGMSFGCTVTTVTSGTGRCGGGASFEQPAPRTAIPPATMRPEMPGANGLLDIDVPSFRARPGRDGTIGCLLD